MPQPRKSSPRRRDRRSRSRSHSPRRRRSRSRSRDRRRSRSPQRRRSPERKYRSPPRRKSPSPRKRSRSPKRRSRSHSPRRSRSHSPRRKGHSPRRRSPSPGERGHPVKRPADSSGKRSGLRSRTPSPSPVKRSREERLYDDEAMYGQPQRSSKQARSPVHDSYGGKMYADQPSSSKQPLFPSGSSKRVAEIDYVIIVEKGPKREKLNKRFETHDQVAHGAFDFEENITIGIHRGPQHIELNDDDDIEVNYDFNPKTFKMLFPKKEYVKTLFDRDEIKAFHHDDILDEEAYVEKRTISIKPVDKPKSRRYNDDLDYKITVGSNREGYGDRRMVQDSGSRSRPSRSSGYDDIPVTVRLDPKPDPRYEKMYRDQQRHEDLSLMQEKVHRNPNDLRYNLMRRKGDGERDRGRDSRERQTGQPSMMDARSRIEARRQESHRDDHYDRRDRAGDGRDSPSRRIERKKATVKIDLPDFKNRPGVTLEKQIVWVIGSSVVKDLKQFGNIFPDYDIQELLKEDVASLVIHGEMDMKIEDILPAVKYLLKKNKPPRMIVFQCGELNVCVGRNVDVIDIVKKDLAAINELIPDVVMVWSQILPPWMIKETSGSTLSKSRRRINTFMMKCFLSGEIKGCFLYHNMLRTDLKTKYHLPTSDGFLHLRKEGMQSYIYQLKTGIRYFMTGHGCIFPYIKWPLALAEISEFDPQHMCMLNVEQIRSLNAKKLKRFSKEQIQMLSNEQISMFHRNQLSFVYREDFVGKLSPKQLAGMSKENFMFLTKSQMSLFTEVEERVKWLSGEVVDFVNKRLKSKKDGDAKSLSAEPVKEEAESNEDKTEGTLGDLMESYGWNDDDDDDDDWDKFSVDSGCDDDLDDVSSVNSENEWLVESRIMAPLYEMRDKSHWKTRGGRGSRSFRGRGISRGWGMGRGRGMRRPFRGGNYSYRRDSNRDESRCRPYSQDNRDRYKNSGYGGRYRSRSRESYERSTHRYRSGSREGYWKSSSREGFERSRSRERYRSLSRDSHRRRSQSRRSNDRHRRRSQSSETGSDRHRRSRSGDRHRRSQSSDRRRRRSRSSERGSDRHRRRSVSSERRSFHGYPVQSNPFQGQFQPPPGMMLPYGMPPGAFPPVLLPGPFPPNSFPGSWPRPPMAAGMPVAQSTVPQPRVTNWGEGPSENAASVNTIKYLDRLGKSTVADDFDLPPDDSLRHGRRQRWGHCSICNVPLTSEQQAIEHVNGRQHCENENSLRDRSSHGSPLRHTDFSRLALISYSNPEVSSWRELRKQRDRGLQRSQNDDLIDRKRHRSNDSEFDRKDVKRRSISEDVGKPMLEYDGADYPRLELLDDNVDAVSGPHTNLLNKIVWIIGTDEMKELQEYCAGTHKHDLGLSANDISLVWKCINGLRIANVIKVIEEMRTEEPNPDCIVLHVGVNDLEESTRYTLKGVAFEMIDKLKMLFPDVKLVWSQLLPKERKRNPLRGIVDDEIASYILEGGGHYIHYPAVVALDRKLFRMSPKGRLEMTTEGILKMMPILRAGLVSIVNRNLTIVPVLQNLPSKVSQFVNRNLSSKFYPRDKRGFKGFSKPKYFKKKFPFARR